MGHLPFNSNPVLRSFLISLLLPGWLCSSAQLYVGPKISLHHAWVRIDDDKLRDVTDMNAKIGFGVAGTVFHPMTSNLNFYGELGYMSKGKDSYDVNTDIADRATYHFLGGRLAMIIELSQGSSRPFIGLGPTGEYWLGGQGEYRRGSRSVQDPLEVDYDINFDSEDSDRSTFEVVDANRLVLGIEFSAGMLMNLGEGQELMIGAFYEVGHSFLGEQTPVGDTNVEIEHLSEVSTRVVGVKTTWLFRRLKKRKTNRRDGNQKPKGKERISAPVKKRKIKG